MTAVVCALSGCGEPVLAWLDDRFCSRTCRFVAQHGCATVMPVRTLTELRARRVTVGCAL